MVGRRRRRRRRRHAGRAGDRRRHVGRPGARHGADAADRHVGGDDRLRHADHVRHGPGRLARHRGGSCPIGQALVAIPFVVRTCCPVLRGVEPRRLEAAATLGASPLRAWRDGRAPPPPPPARRRRRAGRGDLARRVRGDELPVAQRAGDDADRHRAVARPHRNAAPGPGLRPRRDPRRGDDRRRAAPRPRRRLRSAGRRADARR